MKVVVVVVSFKENKKYGNYKIKLNVNCWYCTLSNKALIMYSYIPQYKKLTCLAVYLNEWNEKKQHKKKRHVKQELKQKKNTGNFFTICTNDN